MSARGDASKISLFGRHSISSKRKRWIAAAVLWLVLMYPFGMFPVEYVYGRDWVRFGGSVDQVILPVYRPLTALRDRLPWYDDAADFFFNLGESHR